MRFDKKFERRNDNFETQVAAKEECLKAIKLIDENLEYVTDGLSEYQKIKEHVETFAPVEIYEFELTDDEKRQLEREFDKLQELAEILK